MNQRVLKFRSTVIQWLALLASLLLLASFALFARAAGTWMATGNMVDGHKAHATTLLADGRVLVAGGPDLFFSSAVELFDPATNAWSATGSMSVSRAQHTATTLNDGRVLVAGGIDSPVYASVTYDSAELFDPATGNWTTTGSMTATRSEHTATLLNDGRVLVVGGRSQFGWLHTSTEIYDPVTGIWTATGSMSTSRAQHTATLLNDGRVLVVSLDIAELFDPATGI
ncbi:hypothetical protein KFU94_47780 [Chloroflexi bacterium TSY]|nr:hypothetical protein [Chloroflexi bacterium TSY]